MFTRRIDSSVCDEKYYTHSSPDNHTYLKRCVSTPVFQTKKKKIITRFVDVQKRFVTACASPQVVFNSRIRCVRRNVLLMAFEPRAKTVLTARITFRTKTARKFRIRTRRDGARLKEQNGGKHEYTFIV